MTLPDAMVQVYAWGLLLSVGICASRGVSALATLLFALLWPLLAPKHLACWAWANFPRDPKLW